MLNAPCRLAIRSAFEDSVLAPDTNCPRTLYREEGQAMVEYGLILVLVSVVAVAVLTTVGTDLKAVFTSVDGSLKIPA